MRSNTPHPSGRKERRGYPNFLMIDPTFFSFIFLQPVPHVCVASHFFCAMKSHRNERRRKKKGRRQSARSRTSFEYRNKCSKCLPMQRTVRAAIALRVCVRHENLLPRPTSSHRHTDTHTQKTPAN